MRKQQIIIAFLSTSFTIGYTYSLDLPSTLQAPLRQPPYNFSTIQYNLIYVLTYFLIIFTDIPIGSIVGRIPFKYTISLPLFMCFLMELLLAITLDFRPPGYFYFILICRVIYGVSGQSIFIIQGMIIPKYVKENYQFIVALCWSFGYLSDAINSIVSTQVYENTKNISLPAYISAVVGFYSLMCGIYLIYYMKKLDTQQNLTKSILSNNQQNNLNSNLLQNSQEKNSQNQNYKQQIQQKPQSMIQGLKDLPKEFWMLIAITIITESCTSGCIDNLNDMIIKRFGVPYATAGQLLLIPFGLMSIVTLTGGKLMYLYPKMRRTALLSVFMGNFISTILLYYLPKTNDPSTLHYIVICIYLASISFSLGTYYSGAVSCTANLVQQSSLGLAWGALGTAIAISGFIAPVLYSFIVNFDENNLAEGYGNMVLCTMAISCVSFIIGLILYCQPYGIFDKNYKDLEIDRQNGVSSKQIIEKYKYG